MAEDAWILEIEEEFYRVELLKYEYCDSFNKVSVQEEDERKSRLITEKISKSLKLRDLEEIKFQKYVDDFIKILGETPVIDSLYVLKDYHEQIKNQFGKCKEAFATYISLLDEDEARRELQ